jgi:hypothetical protein
VHGATANPACANDHRWSSAAKSPRVFLGAE